MKMSFTASPPLPPAPQGNQRQNAHLEIDASTRCATSAGTHVASSWGFAFKYSTASVRASILDEPMLDNAWLTADIGNETLLKKSVTTGSAAAKGAETRTLRFVTGDALGQGLSSLLLLIVFQHASLNAGS